MKNLLVVAPILCIALLLALSGTAVAQQTDVFSVNYYSYANTSGAPDATVRVDNPGLTYGDVCSMIYVFTGDQQMAECCGCRNSHNDLRTHSVNTNFTNNPLTGVPPHRGVIKIVAASPNGANCDPTTNVNPVADLRAWGTHIQVTSTGAPQPPTRLLRLSSWMHRWELLSLQTCRRSACHQHPGERSRYLHLRPRVGNRGG